MEGIKADLESKLSSVEKNLDQTKSHLQDAQAEIDERNTTLRSTDAKNSLLKQTKEKKEQEVAALKV